MFSGAVARAVTPSGRALLSYDRGMLDRLYATAERSLLR
jgi:hypothetical protein